MPAKRPIRRSQLISPWGVGQMINFPNDESLMVSGLDLWEEKFRTLNDLEEFRVVEERLAKRLGVKDFRLPPDFRDPGHGVQNASIRIPFVRFPRWHYCARCGHMEKVSIFLSQKPTCAGTAFASGRSCNSIAPNKRQRLIPVRFITVCRDGHIQDFPFLEWVHGGAVPDGNHQLRLRAGRSSGALTGIELSCSCGAQRTMAGAFNENILTNLGITCSGGRPWLGEESDRSNTHHCGQALTVVQKGASNVYFPQIRSSIYLPQWEKSIDRKLVEILERNWNFLTRRRDSGQFERLSFEFVAERYFPAEQLIYFTDKLLAAAARRLAGNDANAGDDSEERYRKMEYDAILSQAGGPNQDFYVTLVNSNQYAAAGNPADIVSTFSSIGLLHKLRETRAFTGFSRLVPEDGKSLDAKKEFIRLGGSISWLPAIVVKGEGVFFQFHSDRILKWAKRPKVVERFGMLLANYSSQQSRARSEKITKPEFVLIHTFAHLLINQFSYECGYGSSSLRERIYCNADFPDDTMHGVLIYTASGDAEGSLGGLVRQGNPGNLEKIVANAIENARWCSSDPVCVESRGQGPDSCNLAACHNCALLPETCCETGNMLLDRAMIIGTLTDPSIGYFNDEQ